MTLHEAIVRILKEKNRWMSTKEIAIEVNRSGLYVKRDGSEVTPFQIHGRTRNYGHLFKRNGSLVGLVEWDKQDDPGNTVEDVRPTHLREENSLFRNDDYDVSKISFLEKKGFIKIGTLGELLDKGLPIQPELKSCGLYAITVTNRFNIEFIPPEECKGKNVINPWPVNRLKDKWVEDADVVYYGIAGSKSFRSLYDRLDDLVEHGRGNISDRGPHKGGEILWQLKNYQKLSVWILPTAGPPVPRKMEKDLLEDFRVIKRKLPFANRQG